MLCDVSDVAFIPYLSNMLLNKMYSVIYAPPGRHGQLGRRIQQELCKDRANRAKRRLHAKMKQFTSKETKEVKSEIKLPTAHLIDKNVQGQKCRNT